MTHKAGSYRLYAGKSENIIVKVNAHGYVLYCDDWEQITYQPDPVQPHRGDKREFFKQNFPSAWFVNEAFYATAIFLY